MGRDEGFETADVAVDLFDDDRVRRLARRIGPEAMQTAMVVLVGTILASWSEGRRVKAEDAAPLWLPLELVEPAVDDLRSVGLLDRSGRVSARSWARRYEPVRERRQRNRERWARYNASRTGDTATVPRGSDAATRPSVPFRSDPIRTSRAPARGERRKATDGSTTEKPKAIGEVLEGTGFREALAAAGYDPSKTGDDR